MSGPSADPDPRHAVVEALVEAVMVANAERRARPGRRRLQLAG